MRRTSFLFVALLLSGWSLLAEEVKNWIAPPTWVPPAPTRSAAEQDTGGLRTEEAQAVPTAALPFFGITPCRLVDTRPTSGFTSAYGPPALVANATRNFDLDSAPHCPGVPAGAQAYSLNVTVTETQGSGDIRIWPTGSFALVSTQNWPSAGVTLANAAIVPAGTNGSVTVQAAGSGTHLIIDINGYYAPIAIVNTLNGLSGAVTLAGSSTVTVTPAGNTLTLNATGGPGGLLPSGSSGLTLRHNGSNWVASTALTNDGTDVSLSGSLILPNPFALQAGDFFFLHNLSGAGGANTYVGQSAGTQPTPGNANTGVGFNALFTAFSGSSNNVALGAYALNKVTTGTGNIGIGHSAGTEVSTGSNNLYIGSAPAGNESNQIRIGRNDVHTQGTVIASIFGFGSSGGIPVIVNSGGRLGTTTSSVRYKEHVRDIGSESDGLMSLRPVAFQYKRDHEPGGLTQYGLIAEEVAEVYPELVVYDEEGRPQAIRSQLLYPLLLNEIQKQSRRIEAQRTEIENLKAELAKLAVRLDGRSEP